MTPDGRILRVAGRQSQLVTSAQVAGAGLSKRQLAVRVERGQLLPVRRTVYRLAGAPATWERAVLAAVLAAPPGTVASHATAAALWSPEVIPRARGTIHLTSPHQARLSGVTVHRRDLSNGQRTQWENIPATRPERTIADLAGVVDDAALGRAADDLVRRRLLHLGRLADLDGGPALRRLLAERLPGFRPNDSEWEARMDALYDELGLPPAVKQYPVVTPNGRYRVDRAIVAARIAIEWKGYCWHGGRGVFDHDCDREADLASSGWQLLGFTAKTSPERIRAAVLGAVARRSPGLLAPS